jgi:hypothetical protein
MFPIDGPIGLSLDPSRELSHYSIDKVVRRCCRLTRNTESARALRTSIYSDAIEIGYHAWLRDAFGPDAPPLSEGCSA